MASPSGGRSLVLFTRLLSILQFDGGLRPVRWKTDGKRHTQSVSRSNTREEGSNAQGKAPRFFFRFVHSSQTSPTLQSKISLVQWRRSTCSPSEPWHTIITQQSAVEPGLMKTFVFVPIVACAPHGAIDLLGLRDATRSISRGLRRMQSCGWVSLYLERRL